MENPPSSRTIEGTAVASTVASMAMRPVETISASSTGPRSDRSPTADSAVPVDAGSKAVTP